MLLMSLGRWFSWLVPAGLLQLHFWSSLPLSRLLGGGEGSGMHQCSGTFHFHVRINQTLGLFIEKH